MAEQPKPDTPEVRRYLFLPTRGPLDGLPASVGDARIFRPWGWSLALVVSEDVKEAMEREGLTGMRFTEV